MATATSPLIGGVLRDFKLLAPFPHRLPLVAVPSHQRWAKKNYNMNHKSPEQALYDDLAATLDYWKVASVESLTDPDVDLSWCDHPTAFRTIQKKLQTSQDRDAIASCMSEILRGLIHSVLVTLDGGSKLAETHSFNLVTSEGEMISSVLHEGFIDHLIRNEHIE